MRVSKHLFMNARIPDIPVAILGRPPEELRDLTAAVLNLHDANNATRHFQSTTHTIRRTAMFGYSYFNLARRDRTFVTIPPLLRSLCSECIEKLALAGCDNLGSAEQYTNVILSFYEKGYRLEPHEDVDQTHLTAEGTPADFFFGESVIGCVIQNDESSPSLPPGSFFVQTEGTRKVLDERPGLVYLLDGVLRRAPFLHGVTVVQKSRISVTFRTVHFRS